MSQPKTKAQKVNKNINVINMVWEEPKAWKGKEEAEGEEVKEERKEVKEEGKRLERGGEKRKHKNSNVSRLNGNCFAFGKCSGRNLFCLFQIRSFYFLQSNAVSVLFVLWVLCCYDVLVWLLHEH